MPAGRIVAALTASVAVAGCAVVVLGMTNAVSEPDATASTGVSAAPTSRPAFVQVAGVGSSPVPAAAAPRVRPVTRTTPPVATTRAVPASTTNAAPVTPAAARTVVRPAVTPAVTPVAKPAAQRAAKPVQRRVTQAPRAAPKASGQRLPLRYSTGSATKVITVTARSHGSTVATLQAWTKVTGGWKRYGSAISAHVGAQGIGTASESSSHTPQGTFTLTQAFGRKSDPGTALPYFRTTPSDYWISDAGRLYNTHQRCGSCGYDDGVNERLYYETPFYNYAVVIDYNTRNAPGGVHKGRGSAFFLHVTDGRPTAGCVAIPQSRLVPLMRWLTPRSHPRILIGIT